MHADSAFPSPWHTLFARTLVQRSPKPTTEAAALDVARTCATLDRHLPACHAAKLYLIDRHFAQAQ